MSINKSTTITSELLDDLEKTSGLKEIATQQHFLEVLKLNKAIIYLLVDWSGPERISRYFIYKALNEIDKIGIPIFKIDCSDQKKKYVVDWIIGQRENGKDCYYGGWGETLLIEKGEVVGFIRNPGHIGREKTKEEINKWKNKGAF